MIFGETERCVHEREREREREREIYIYIYIYIYKYMTQSEVLSKWVPFFFSFFLFFWETNTHTQERGKGVLTQKHTTIPLKNHFHHLYHILLIDHFHHLYQILLHYCLTVFTVYQFAKIISYDLFSFPFFWERKLVMIFNVKNCIIKFNIRDTT